MSQLKTFQDIYLFPNLIPEYNQWTLDRYESNAGVYCSLLKSCDYSHDKRQVNQQEVLNYIDKTKGIDKTIKDFVSKGLGKRLEKIENQLKKVWQ